jgi:N-sulfoglucosamine sulfohydrolase
MISKRLNIIQIIWHDLGRHLSCYGAGSVNSPCIDRMASEGMLFENHFSTGPVCVPSRCSILTGRYPHAQELWRFNENEVTLPKVLCEAGYATYRFGFREEGEFFSLETDMDMDAIAKNLLGYQNTWEESCNSMQIAEKVCDFLNNDISSRPFYCCIEFSDVHRPNEVFVDEYTIEHTMIPKILPSLPDTYESLKDIAILEKRIGTADKAVGQILDCVRSLGLTSNALVILTTDHGVDLPRAKMTLYDAGIQAASIWWGPDFVPKNKRDCNLHSHMDIFPTIMDLLDIPIPGRIQGESFAPALLGIDYIPREFIFAERSWEAWDDPVRAIRTAKYKYIRNYCPDWPIPVPPEYAKKVGMKLIEERYGAPRPYEEFYDIEKDPYEIQNLASDPQYLKEKTILAEKMTDMLEKDNDPVLKLDSYLSYLKELKPGKWQKKGNCFSFNI